MSYAQAMKHWKNHKKDRYYQQIAPLITTNDHKEEFIVKTIDGDFRFYAYCYEHAAQIATAQGLKVIEQAHQTEKGGGSDA